MKNKHTVGHTGPALPFRRAVLALGESFGAKVKPIAYDGSGATKTGLYNGEVDYVMISKKHALDIVKNGGKCFYEYSANQDSSFVALATLDPSNLRLIAGYDAVWLAINMSDYEIKKLRKDFYKNVNVTGKIGEYNEELAKAVRVADFLELGELFAKDALERNESCGGHFREEYQTKDGEAIRDDKDFKFVSAWEYVGEPSDAKLHKEDLKYEEIEVKTRSYK